MNYDELSSCFSSLIAQLKKNSEQSDTVIMFNLIQGLLSRAYTNRYFLGEGDIDSLSDESINTILKKLGRGENQAILPLIKKFLDEVQSKTSDKRKEINKYTQTIRQLEEIIENNADIGEKIEKCQRELKGASQREQGIKAKKDELSQLEQAIALVSTRLNADEKPDDERIAVLREKWEKIQAELATLTHEGFNKKILELCQLQRDMVVFANLNMNSLIESINALQVADSLLKNTLMADKEYLTSVDRLKDLQSELESSLLKVKEQISSLVKMSQNLNNLGEI